jgi:hypothetical protein
VVVLRVVGLLLVAAAACGSPSVDDGEIGCGPDGDCPSGFLCAADNRCRKQAVPPPDGPAGPDARRDATSPQCPGGCADENPCTQDECVGPNDCDNRPLIGAPCGDGCECLGGLPHEVICEDGSDNDLDGFSDCNDPDDCPCALFCCSDGRCTATCF